MRGPLYLSAVAILLDQTILHGAGLVDDLAVEAAQERPVNARGARPLPRRARTPPRSAPAGEPGIPVSAFSRATSRTTSNRSAKQAARSHRPGQSILLAIGGEAPDGPHLGPDSCAGARASEVAADAIALPISIARRLWPAGAADLLSAKTGAGFGLSDRLLAVYLLVAAPGRCDLIGRHRLARQRGDAADRRSLWPGLDLRPMGS